MSSAWQEGLRFLEAGLKSGTWQRGHQLPPVRRLAVSAGVSVPTMLKAIRDLERRGLLHAVAGQAVWAGPRTGGDAAPSVQGPAMPGLAWKRVADDLARSIARTEIDPAGAFPSVKQLVVRYETSTPTVGHALRECAKLGLVERAGRRWRLKRRTVARDATIVLIGLGQDRRSLQIMHPRTPDHLRLVEQNCMAAGVNLRVVPVPHGNGSELAGRAAVRMVDESLAGSVVIGHILWAPLMAPAFLAAIADHLRRRGQPLAIFHEWLYAPPYDPGTSRQHQVAQFAVGSHEEAATEVGTYLFGLGHRHIAYISPFHRSQWSRGRQATLETLAGAAGASVHPFTIERFEDAHEHYLADEAAGRYTDFRDSYHGLASPEALSRGELGRAWGSSLLPMLMRRSVAANLEPLVLAMLDRKDITACVAANDQTALIVMDIAARRGVRVPRDLAVVGFDNSFECVNRDLTSYDFNLAAAARATVNHVLMPGAAAHARERLMRINGILVRRGSA